MNLSSVSAAMTTEKEARERAERRIAQCEKTHADQIGVLAVIAQRQIGREEVRGPQAVAREMQNDVAAA